MVFKEKSISIFLRELLLKGNGEKDEYQTLTLFSLQDILCKAFSARQNACTYNMNF